jgi:hypothetical protein
MLSLFCRYKSKDLLFKIKTTSKKKKKRVTTRKETRMDDCGLQRCHATFTSCVGPEIYAFEGSWSASFGEGVYGPHHEALFSDDVVQAFSAV